MYANSVGCHLPRLCTVKSCTGMTCRHESTRASQSTSPSLCNVRKPTQARPPLAMMPADPAAERSTTSWIYLTTYVPTIIVAATKKATHSPAITVVLTFCRNHPIARRALHHRRVLESRVRAVSEPDRPAAWHRRRPFTSGHAARLSWWLCCCLALRGGRCCAAVGSCAGLRLIRLEAPRLRVLPCRHAPGIDRVLSQTRRGLAAHPPLRSPAPPRWALRFPRSRPGSWLEPDHTTARDPAPLRSDRPNIG